jgi:hypothetical protein
MGYTFTVLIWRVGFGRTTSPLFALFLFAEGQSLKDVLAGDGERSKGWKSHRRMARGGQ